MRWLRTGLTLLVWILHPRSWPHLTWMAGLCRRPRLTLIALLGIGVLHC